MKKLIFFCENKNNFFKKLIFIKKQNYNISFLTHTFENKTFAKLIYCLTSIIFILLFLHLKTFNLFSTRLIFLNLQEEKKYIE